LNWYKIEIIKMPKKHDDSTTYRAFMYEGEKVVNLVEFEWLQDQTVELEIHTEQEALNHLVSMALNIK
jgi:hypothetical protein